MFVNSFFMNVPILLIITNTKFTGVKQDTNKIYNIWIIKQLFVCFRHFIKYQQFDLKLNENKCLQHNSTTKSDMLMDISVKFKYQFVYKIWWLNFKWDNEINKTSSQNFFFTKITQGI